MHWIQSKRICQKQGVSGLPSSLFDPHAKNVIIRMLLDLRYTHLLSRSRVAGEHAVLRNKMEDTRSQIR